MSTEFMLDLFLQSWPEHNQMYLSNLGYVIYLFLDRLKDKQSKLANDSQKSSLDRANNRTDDAIALDTKSVFQKALNSLGWGAFTEFFTTELSSYGFINFETDFIIVRGESKRIVDRLFNEIRDLNNPWENSPKLYSNSDLNYVLKDEGVSHARGRKSTSNSYKKKIKKLTDTQKKNLESFFNKLIEIARNIDREKDIADVIRKIRNQEPELKDLIDSLDFQSNLEQEISATEKAKQHGFDTDSILNHSKESHLFD